MKTSLIAALLFQTLAFGSFDYERLKDLIQKENLSRVEEVLPRLPTSLRSNFVIVYDSRSLQDATAEKPRVIFFEPNASFFLSINGDTEQQGGAFLEILEQNVQLNKSTFHEISFEKSKPTFQTNPPICFTCHTGFGQPLWDPSPVWPGVFGSLTNKGPLFSKDEAPLIARFFKNMESHVRYRHLEGKNSEDFSYASLSLKNELFTQMLYRAQAERLSLLLKKEARNRITPSAWLYPQKGEGFIGELPPNLRKIAKEAYAEAIPYLCKRILMAASRRVKRQLQIASLSSEKERYPVIDLEPLEAIARAYALAHALGLLEEFKDLSSPTLDRETYVSSDGSLGLWGHFYGFFGELSPELLKGPSAWLKRENEIFRLAEPHPVCGNSFKWPEL